MIDLPTSSQTSKKRVAVTQDGGRYNTSGTLYVENAKVIFDDGTTEEIVPQPQISIAEWPAIATRLADPELSRLVAEVCAFKAGLISESELTQPYTPPAAPKADAVATPVGP